MAMAGRLPGYETVANRFERNEGLARSWRAAPFAHAALTKPA